MVDPAVFDACSCDEFEVTFTPGDEWSVHFPLQEDVGPYVGTATTFGSAGTSLLGLESLFNYQIQMTNQTPGGVLVHFASNPTLGLDDNAVRSEIQSRYSYDAATGDYNFAGEFSITVTFQVPESFYGEVTITTGYGGEIEALI